MTRITIERAKLEQWILKVIRTTKHVNNEAFVEVMMMRDDMNEALKKALAAQQAPVQEPWGFHIQFNNGKDATFKGLNHLAECEAHLESGETITMIYTTPPAAPVPLTDDTRRLDALAKNSWDLRCFDMSDDDIGWRVIEHHMQRPHERKLAEVFRDDPRQAIDAAIEAAHGITAAPEKGGAA